MIALQRGVRRRSAWLRSMQRVLSSTSTSTTSAPRWRMTDAVRREGQRRHDDVIARTDTASLGGEMQSCCRRIHCDGLDVAAHESCEFLFELARLRSGGEPSGPQHGDCRLDLVLADIGPEARYFGGSGARLYGDLPRESVRKPGNELL